MKMSIVTPCYNSGMTIERTIKSVIEQKINFPLEYIIVDGLSSDDTMNIVKRYADQYPYIKYLSEKDNSMTEALNKGMKLTTGDIVASINADDIYLPNALQKVMDYFESNSADVLMVNTYFVNAETNLIKSKNMPRIFSPLLTAFTECPFPECGVFFRGDVIRKIGFFNENIRYTQDFELYLRIKKSGYTFRYKNIDASCFFVSQFNYSSTICDQMNEEVYSYFKYSGIFKIFGQSTASKVLKILFRFRSYYVFKKKELDV